MNKLKIKSDGSILGVPEAVKKIQSQTEHYKNRDTQNQTTCGGTNRKSCVNSGTCTDTNNKNYCSNTGTCDSATIGDL